MLNVFTGPRSNGAVEKKHKEKGTVFFLVFFFLGGVDVFYLLFAVSNNRLKYSPEIIK